MTAPPGIDKMYLRNGRPLAVIRPAQPAKAIQMSGDKAAYDRILAECGPYTFVGYLKQQVGFLKRRDVMSLVDARGADCGRMESGDSFVDPDSVAALNVSDRVEHGLADT